ncbi:hypothetical protein SG1153 [Sodalis glossinidius str. 'morsitans']|uniref:Uncharacterized protein n=2 Tax=Sodalis glossinidius (strain morsitans) TaxID=343509 RepID=Q2NTU7_SODGM|nr:hypothetical protein SG1153 [Sodalis glossinidius str. 'morsitans']
MMGSRLRYRNVRQRAVSDHYCCRSDESRSDLNYRRALSQSSCFGCFCQAMEIIMANDPYYQVLLDRIEALEARERQLTVTSHAYQVVLTTILGNLDVQTRDRIITMVDEAHEIAYSQAVNRSDRHLSEVIKGADEVVQRMFNYAQGNPHSGL